MATSMYPARFNIRVTQETYDAYYGAAAALNIEPTQLARQCLEASVRAMQALEQSVTTMKQGRVAEGAGLYAALMESVAADSQLHRLRAQAIAQDASSVSESVQSASESVQVAP